MIKKIKFKNIMEFIERNFDIIKLILIFLLILFGWIVFEGRLMDLFDEHVLPILSVKEFYEAKIICVLILFVTLLFCVHLFYKAKKYRYHVSLLRILLLSMVVFLYAKYRDFGLGWGDYISIPNIIWKFGFSDILVFILMVFVILFWYFFFFSKKAIVNNKDNFLPDTPIKNKNEDALDYRESANELAKYLESIDTTFSYSIGLTAPWGTGKTSYMNLIKESLFKDENKFIVVQFNPRHSFSPQNIQEDFFKILSSKLKKYNSTIKSNFTDYLKAINIYADSKIISTFLGSQKLWDKESEKEKISKAIKKTGKRVVVFIDDFDRLLVEEIIEIFKLIDGNASFSNMIFITAYDKKQINNLIKEEYHSKGSFFSDKFFTLEIQIPLRPYRKVYEYLLQKLFIGLNISIGNENLYKATLNKHFDLLKKYLTTLRDVKRFLNLFIRQYKQVEKEINFEDYFLLYLIKYKYLDEYLALYNKEYVEFDFPKNKYIIKEISDEVQSKELLEILFSEEAEKSYRSINDKASFDIYFDECLYNNLSISKMEEMFKISLEEAKSFIDGSVSNSMFKDLLEYLESKNILIFNSKDDFERYLDLLIYIDCKEYDTTTPRLTIYKLLYKENLSEIFTQHSYSENEYKEMILRKLKGNYPNYPFSITKSIITGLINSEFNREIIFTKKEVLEVAKSAFENFVSHEQHINQKHIDMLYSCISEIDQSSGTVLDEDACLLMKRTISENPAGYFENFVRLGMWSSNPEYNSIACEPFWDQIFDSKKEMSELINTHHQSIPNIRLINNFLKLYENNNYTPIQFEGQGKVQDKIDNNLETEIRDLDDLLKKESEFNNLEQERGTKGNETSVGEYKMLLREYETLLNKVENIHLDIPKRGEIIQGINVAIQSIDNFLRN